MTIWLTELIYEQCTPRSRLTYICLSLNLSVPDLFKAHAGLFPKIIVLLPSTHSNSTYSLELSQKKVFYKAFPGYPSPLSSS